jgi:thioredoxin
MKKIILILSLIVGVGLVSCNQNATDNKLAEAVEEKASQISHETSTPGDIKPIYLTTEEFREKVWDYEANPEEWVYNGDLPCVVDFYADWCKPCKMVAPIMDDLADYYAGRVIIYKVNTDDQRELSSVFQVRSIPSILFAPINGKPAMQPGAMSKEQYIEIINDFVLKENKTNNEQKES